MRGFVVSRFGTFGTVSREYRAEDGTPCVVIRWGPLGWLTPVRRDDVHRCVSSYESEARKEAGTWLDSLRCLEGKP